MRKSKVNSWSPWVRVVIPGLSFGPRVQVWAKTRAAVPRDSLPALHAIDATLATSPPRRWRMSSRRRRPAASMAWRPCWFHTGPDLDLVEHRAPRTTLVGELLLAFHVFDDELAVGVVLVDGVELLLPARRIAVVEW